MPGNSFNNEMEIMNVRVLHALWSWYAATFFQVICNNQNQMNLRSNSVYNFASQWNAEQQCKTMHKRGRFKQLAEVA